MDRFCFTVPKYHISLSFKSVPSSLSFPSTGNFEKVSDLLNKAKVINKAYYRVYRIEMDKNKWLREVEGSNLLLNHCA